MRKVFKIILLGFILLVLISPLIQTFYPFINRNDVLYGYFVPAHDTTFTMKNWFNRGFQETKDAFLNENFGFRNFLVKLNNQVNFSFFSVINVNEVYKGEKNYLFTEKFLDNYSGVNYKGEKYVDSVYNDLNALNKALKARNKKLLICFLPCKESFYSEYLHAEDKLKLKSVNYYTEYVKRIRKSDIPLLDFNSYCVSQKGKFKHPVFTQGAVHLTTYGTYLMFDTLLKKMTYEFGKKINLLNFKSIELSDSARYSDDDISKAMNLLENVNSEELAYPMVDFVYNTDSCYKPKVLVIGDSFYYGINNTFLPLYIFNKESYFIYYFKTAIPYDLQKKVVDVSELNLTKELDNTDMVVLFFSIGTLDNFPYGATNLAHNLK